MRLFDRKGRPKPPGRPEDASGDVSERDEQPHPRRGRGRGGPLDPDRRQQSNVPPPGFYGDDSIMGRQF